MKEYFKECGKDEKILFRKMEKRLGKLREKLEKEKIKEERIEMIWKLYFYLFQETISREKEKLKDNYKKFVGNLIEHPNFHKCIFFLFFIFTLFFF